jgi:3-oxoacyl-[acyl-carrier protein] reductase
VVPSYVFLAGEEGRHYHGQCISPNGGDQFL